MPGLYDDLAAYLDDDERAANAADSLYTQLGARELSDEAAPPPLLERLNQQLDEREVGVTPLDVMKLQGLPKEIMLLMLRDSHAATLGISFEGLQQQLAQTAQDIRHALESLAQQNWIFVAGEPPQLRYRVHMKRKRSSTLDIGIWALLAQRLDSSTP